MTENRTADGVFIKAGMKVWWAVNGKRFTVALDTTPGSPHMVTIKKTRTMGLSHNLLFPDRTLHATRFNALIAGWRLKYDARVIAEQATRKLCLEEEAARVKAAKALKRSEACEVSARSGRK